MTVLIPALGRIARLKNTVSVERYGINNQQVIKILEDKIQSMKESLPSRLQERKFIESLESLTSVYPTRDFWGNRLDEDDRIRCSLGLYSVCLASSIGIAYITEGITGKQAFLAPTVIVSAPLAVSLASHCIEPLYNPVANICIQGIHRYTIVKIQGLIDRLKIFGSLPLQGASLSIFLSERSLPKETYQEIVARMSIGQQLELQKRRKNFVSIPCGQRIHPEESLEIIKAIQNINTLSDDELEGAIYQLEERMRSDPTIWEEIMKTLTLERVEKIKGLLTRLGKEILSLNDEDFSALVAKLRGTHSKMIQLSIKISDRYQKTVTVRYSDLIQYPYFAARLTGGFTESGQETIDLGVEEEGAVDAVIHFIQTQEIEPTEELARSVLPLSERLGIEDLSIICFNYLKSDREKVTPTRRLFLSPMRPLISLFPHKESPSEFLAFLFKYGQTPFLVQQTRKMLQDAFKHAELVQDLKLLDALLTIGVEYTGDDPYLDVFLSHYIQSNESSLWVTNPQFLGLLFKHDSLTNIQNKVRKYLTDCINDDLSILRRCSNIPTLYRRIEGEYIKRMGTKTFRQLWEYGEAHDQEVLKNACKQFLRDAQEKSELLRLWQVGKLPEGLTEVCREALDT